MRMPRDDGILNVLREDHEASAVPRDADEEVTVSFGMFLRVPQRFGVDDVELDVKSPEIEVPANQSREVAEISLRFKRFGRQFDVQERPAAVAFVVDP